MFSVCKAWGDHGIKAEIHGEQRGKEEGEYNANKRSLTALMENMNISLDEAMILLKIPAEDRQKYEVLK